MADKSNQFEGVVESLLSGMNSVLSTKTVVGEPTQVGDTIILPLVDVSFGIGAGAHGYLSLSGKPAAILTLKEKVSVSEQCREFLLHLDGFLSELKNQSPNGKE